MLNITIKRAVDLTVEEDTRINEVDHLAHETPVPYYKKFGWQLLEDPMLFDWRGTKRVFAENTMVLQLGEQTWQRGMVDLCGKPW